MSEHIPLKIKKIWEISKGHNPHRSGSGKHDNRPKRLRTRSAEKRFHIKDQFDD